MIDLLTSLLGCLGYACHLIAVLAEGHLSRLSSQDFFSRTRDSYILDFDCIYSVSPWELVTRRNRCTSLFLPLWWATGPQRLFLRQKMYLGLRGRRTWVCACWFGFVFFFFFLQKNYNDNKIKLQKSKSKPIGFK